MATRITPLEAAQDAGYDSIEECLNEVTFGTSHCPACCSEGCETEPDGHCEHGYPSIMLAIGVI
jgi:hypothetical protein